MAPALLVYLAFSLLSLCTSYGHLAADAAAGHLQLTVRQWSVTLKMASAAAAAVHRLIEIKKDKKAFGKIVELHRHIDCHFLHLQSVFFLRCCAVEKTGGSSSGNRTSSNISSTEQSSWISQQNQITVKERMKRELPPLSSSF